MEIGAEAALFPEKEYVNGIAVALLYGTNISKIIYEIKIYCKEKKIGQGIPVVRRRNIVQNTSIDLLH